MPFGFSVPQMVIVLVAALRATSISKRVNVR